MPLVTDRSNMRADTAVTSAPVSSRNRIDEFRTSSAIVQLLFAVSVDKAPRNAVGAASICPTIWDAERAAHPGVVSYFPAFAAGRLPRRTIIFWVAITSTPVALGVRPL